MQTFRHAQITANVVYRSTYPYVCILPHCVPITGYLPDSEEQWQQLFETFKDIDEQHCDWPNHITWEKLAILLVQYRGPENAVSLLEGLDLPDGVLDSEFYQTCLLSGMVQQQQRYVH